MAAESVVNEAGITVIFADVKDGGATQLFASIIRLVTYEVVAVGETLIGVPET